MNTCDICKKEIEITDIYIITNAPGVLCIDCHSKDRDSDIKKKDNPILSRFDILDIRK